MDARQPENLQEALLFLSDHIQPIQSSLLIDSAIAAGHVLAEDCYSPISLPRFDNAAMDGFAVRSSDLAADGTATLRLAQTIAAGDTLIARLERGNTARIMTGARVPEGASRVVMQEYAEIVGNSVALRALPGGKDHIRRIGEDVQQGNIILQRGTLLHAGHIALLIGLGVRTVKVRAKPKVAVVSTGNELVQSQTDLMAGQIYDTNRPMLVEMLKNAGAEVTDLGIIEDNPGSIRSVLVAAGQEHDLIISSGGASQGFADHLSQTVSQNGRLAFWNLGMRPGKPIGFGSIGHCPILVLPGNPVAAASGFAILGRSVLKRLNGGTIGSLSRSLPLAQKLTKPAGKTHLIMARLSQDEVTGRTELAPLSNQSSASYHSLAMSEVFVIMRPEQTCIDRGENADFVPIWN